jgi:hypothetical protein
LRQLWRRESASQKFAVVMPALDWRAASIAAFVFTKIENAVARQFLSIPNRKTRLEIF